MGRKKLTPKRAMLSQKPSEEEVRLAARDWAEFLYDEYCIEKHNQLLLVKKRRTIKKLTNHDQPNS